MYVPELHDTLSLVANGYLAKTNLFCPTLIFTINKNSGHTCDAYYLFGS